MSSTQAGVPDLIYAEAELKAAIAGEVEMACAVQLLMQLGETMKARILWADSSAYKSILTSRGLGRLKQLEVSQVYLQEKTRPGELR